MKAAIFARFFYGAWHDLERSTVNENFVNFGKTCLITSGLHNKTCSLPSKDLDPCVQSVVTSRFLVQISDFSTTENPRLKPDQNGGLPNEYSSMHYADGGQYVSRDNPNDKALWLKDTYLNPRMRDTNVLMNLT